MFRKIVILSLFLLLGSFTIWQKLEYDRKLTEFQCLDNLLKEITSDKGVPKIVGDWISWDKHD